MQPERTVGPKFDRQRHNAVTDPIGRARHLLRVLFFVMRDRGLQRAPAFERPRLLARPGADLRAARAMREVIVGLPLRNPLDRPLVKKTKPRSSNFFTKTMRTSGSPAESTVASAAASASHGSLLSASCIQRANRPNGSSVSGKSPKVNPDGRSMSCLLAMDGSGVRQRDCLQGLERALCISRIGRLRSIAELAGGCPRRGDGRMQHVLSLAARREGWR